MTTIRRLILRLLSFFRLTAGDHAMQNQTDARGFRWLDNSRMDFTLGARMLAKYPALSVIGGAGLAVGVAIGAGFFAFLYSFFLRHAAGRGR